VKLLRERTGGRPTAPNTVKIRAAKAGVWHLVGIGESLRPRRDKRGAVIWNCRAPRHLDWDGRRALMTGAGRGIGLAFDHAPDGSIGLSNLDGFFDGYRGGAGVEPAERMAAGDLVLQTEVEMRTVLGTIMGRYNEIVALH
jgi:hypothetical protein